MRRGRLYRAAWDGDELAGYIGFLMVDDEAHMTTIATAPAYQRAGVATALIVDAMGTLRTMGIRQVSLEVAANNDKAQSLYRRFGFAPVGVRKNYYPVTGQDALVMWVYDVDSDEYAGRLEASAAAGAPARRAPDRTLGRDPARRHVRPCRRARRGTTAGHGRIRGSVSPRSKDHP